MFLHGCFGFIGVHDLLAIQENGDAPPVGELIPEEGRHLAAENLNPILRLRMQRRRTDYRGAVGGRNTEDLRLRSLFEVLLGEHFVPRLQKVWFSPL